MDDAGAVARVGVVVDREQVAALVERQLLRVPQPGGEQLQLAAVGPAAQDGAGVEVRQHAVGRLDVQPAVADREVDAAVGPQAQAVQVVAEQGDVDAEARGQRALLVGLPVAVGVAQLPQRGDAGEEQPVAVPHHAGGGAVDDVVEALGEYARPIVDAVAVAVLDQADQFAVVGELARADRPRGG